MTTIASPFPASNCQRLRLLGQRLRLLERTLADLREREDTLLADLAAAESRKADKRIAQLAVQHSDTVRLIAETRANVRWYREQIFLTLDSADQDNLFPDFSDPVPPPRHVESHSDG